MENLKSVPVLAKDPHNRSPDHPSSPDKSTVLNENGQPQRDLSFDAESMIIPGDPFGPMTLAELHDANEPAQPILTLKSRLPGTLGYDQQKNVNQASNTEISWKAQETASKSSLTKENLDEENRHDLERKSDIKVTLDDHITPLEKAKDKENINPVGAKKGKKQFHNPLGLKVLKDTFNRKWGKKAAKNDIEAASSITNMPVVRARTLADLELEADEVNEKDQEKITQVSRTNRNVKNVVDLGASHLGGSQVPEVAQEENPVSNGTVKIALDQSLRPAHSHVDRHGDRRQSKMTTRPDELKIHILQYPEKSYSRTVSFEGQTKEGTKTTIDSMHRGSILNFETFSQKLPKHTKNMQAKNINLPKRLSLTEKLLFYCSIVFVGALMFYFLLPLAILFLAYDYGNDDIRNYFNFTILGLMQGLTEILLIQYMVDRPLLRRIKEIQEENMRVVDTSKYKILNRYNCTLVLCYTTGLEVCAGIAIRKMGYSVNAVTVLLSMICIVILGAFLWFVITLVQTPPTTPDKKKVLNRELTEIGEIRKNFIKDLQSRKKELDKRSRTFVAGIDIVSKDAYHPQLGAINSLEPNIRLDVRKFQGDLSQYSSELTRYRLNVVRVYGVFLLALLQLLALLTLLRVTNYKNDNGIAMGLIIVIGVISTIFGEVEQFISSSRQATTIITKIINLTVIGGVYRFFYLIAPSKGVMIGTAILKFGSKILFYYIPLFHHKKLKKSHNRILSKCFELKEDNDMQYTQEEKERLVTRPLKHIFHKFIVVQNADLFFGLGTLTLLAMSMRWAPDLNMGLTLKIENFDFYTGLVLLEALVNVLVWIHFSHVAKKKIQEKVPSLQIEGFNEIHNVFKKRKRFVVTFSSLVLFLLLFIFMNGL